MVGLKNSWNHKKNKKKKIKQHKLYYLKLIILKIMKIKYILDMDSINQFIDQHMVIILSYISHSC